MQLEHTESSPVLVIAVSPGSCHWPIQLMAQRGARAGLQGVEAIQAAEGGDARTNTQLSPV